MNDEKTLVITSKTFSDNGFLPKRNTGFGEDFSPDFAVEKLPAEAASLVIIMYDLDIPLIGKYPHWLIWNIPAQSVIPENIPHGGEVPSLGNARQGTAYGKNRYRGPKQPFFITKMHRYEFDIFALDAMLELDFTANAAMLTAAMEGHVLASGTIIGKYKR